MGSRGHYNSRACIQRDDDDDEAADPCTGNKRSRNRGRKACRTRRKTETVLPNLSGSPMMAQHKRARRP